MQFLRRRIKITSVQERVLVARPVEQSVRQCPKCTNGHVMVTAAAAAQITKQSLRTICRLIDTGQVHYCEDDDGLFVCLSSLPKMIEL